MTLFLVAHAGAISLGESTQASCAAALRADHRPALVRLYEPVSDEYKRELIPDVAA